MLSTRVSKLLVVRSHRSSDRVTISCRQLSCILGNKYTAATHNMNSSSSIHPVAVSVSNAQRRYLSSTNVNETDAKKDGEQESKSVGEFDYDAYEDYEPRTAGEKVAVYSRLAFGLMLLSLAGVGIYYSVDVLFPGRMSPYSVFSAATDRLKINDEIVAITGEPVKAFGKDTGGDSRRTNLDFRQYEEDDSKRTRVRFNMKGPRGHVVVWAEVSNKMAHGEYVLLICQDRRTRKVITIEDNRDRLEAEKLAARERSPSLYEQVAKYIGFA